MTVAVGIEWEQVGIADRAIRGGSPTIFAVREVHTRAAAYWGEPVAPAPTGQGARATGGAAAAAAVPMTLSVESGQHVVVVFRTGNVALPRYDGGSLA
jgi:hypothetical protein